MAIFKRGDKVRVIQSTMVVSRGWEGIVNEDDSVAPFVKFSDCEWSVSEDKLTLVHDNSLNNNYEIY